MFLFCSVLSICCLVFDCRRRIYLCPHSRPRSYARQIELSAALKIYSATHIVPVVQLIADAEKKCVELEQLPSSASRDATLAYWRSKEVQLRNEKALLLTKKGQLRDEKNRLMADGKRDSRSASPSHAVYSCALNSIMSSRCSLIRTRLFQASKFSLSLVDLHAQSSRCISITNDPFHLKEARKRFKIFFEETEARYSSREISSRTQFDEGF